MKIDLTGCDPEILEALQKRASAETRKEPAKKKPITFVPRGLSRVEASGYIGISPPLFDEMVKDGRMPHPKRINSRKVWDRHELDAYFDELPQDEAVDPWAFIDE